MSRKLITTMQLPIVTARAAERPKSRKTPNTETKKTTVLKLKIMAQFVMQID
jgi:hypothetical protein